jgi:predicted nucleic acid-binding protein
MVYVDTSVIVKLYIREELSREASNWIKKNNEALPLTRLHELEFTNAIQLKRFRSEVTEDETLVIMTRFKEHENKGVFYRPQLDWSEIFNYAVDLSEKHTPMIGARSLDILHIAAALSIKAEKFLTLDGRQTEVARLAGLKIVEIVHQ